MFGVVEGASLSFEMETPWQKKEMISSEQTNE